jgi:TonB family protein
MYQRLLILILLFIHGCGTQAPPIPSGGPSTGGEAVEVIALIADSIPASPPLAVILEGPTITPYTVRPRILNREEVLRAQEREYPEDLRSDGVTGTVRIWFLLDDEGLVLRRVLEESSGHERLDAAGLRVAQVHRFSAALNREKPVYVWISLPVRFGGR